MKAGITCPACKKGKLKKFYSSSTIIVFTCTNCDKTMTGKTVAGEIIELAIPGMAIITGSIGILSFFDIDSFEDLVDLLN